MFFFKNERTMINGKRFVQTVKWTETVLFPTTVKQFLVLCILFLALAAMMSRGFAGANVGDGDALLWVSVSILACIASCVVSDLKRNQDRIFTFMLPASTLEKYLARVLHVTMGFVVVSLAALAVADLLQALIHLVMRTPATSLTADTFDSIVGVFSNVENTREALSMTSGLLVLVHLQSCYLLGGMFFRRTQWLQTTLFGLLLLGLFGGAVTWLAFAIEDGQELEGYALDVYGTLWMVIVVQCLFIALNYWLAYRLFKRMQLISNKWLNL